MQDRVCYFSRGDLSIRYYLSIAKKRITEIEDGNVPSDLEGIIELWHIKRMMDDGCRLQEWTDSEYEQLKSLTSGYNIIIAKFFKGLDPQTVNQKYKKLELTYKRSFWKIIEAYKFYELIEPNALQEIIFDNFNNLRMTLECPKLVEKQKVIIREILLSNPRSAHIILDIYVSKQEFRSDNQMFLPSNLSLEDKEDILKNYLKSDNPNVNYVRLITQIKDSSQIRISPKTRLHAEKLAKKLNEELISNPNTVTLSWSFAIKFVEEEIESPVEIEFNEYNLPTSYTYSIPYIKKCNNARRIGNCVSLFGWLDKHCLISLINKKTEVGTFESILMDHGRDSYPAFSIFNYKNDLSLHQLNAYINILSKNDSSFEFELKTFYEQYLKLEYRYPSLSINIPRADDSVLNKCRVICPELDSIVKQYSTFVDEDEIDNDLIRLSKPLKVEEGKSLLINKYYEVAENNDEIKGVLFGLFGSNCSLLSYVDPFKDKNYKSLIELLEKERDVLYSNYADFQKPHLDFLIQQGVIGINDGCINIVNPSAISVLKSLWEYGVCSYWHYNEEERKSLDEMLSKGWLIQDNHLLCKPERDYFSFFLDNMKYTNGFAFRNHYMHGSTPPMDDENTHAIAYLTFLKLLALLLLKIEDDLWLAQRAFACYRVSEYKKGLIYK